MKFFGWQVVIAFAVMCLLTACEHISGFTDCLTSNTNHGKKCSFMASIGIPI